MLYIITLILALGSVPAFWYMVLKLTAYDSNRTGLTVYSVVPDRKTLGKKVRK